jgi:serine/threonine-protein kinase
MLTGSKPFVSESSYTVLNAQINDAPKPLIEINPDLPAELNEIVLKAMEKDPGARFQNADAMRNALRSVRGGQAAAAPASASAAAVMGATAVAGAVPSVTVAVSGGSAAASTPASAPAVNETPKFTPVPQVAQKGKSNRGLWITLGAVAAVLAIVAVATLVPRFYPMFAKHNSASNTTIAQADVPPAPVTPISSQPVETTNPNPQTTTPMPNAPAVPVNPGISGGSGQRREPGSPRQRYVANAANAAAASVSAPAANASPEPAGPDPAQMREVKDKLMNLTSRADAARGGVDSLRRQQQAQGYDLRTDIVSSLNRMNSNLAEAQQSLNAGDLSAANEYMSRAETEVAKLEAFLGH